MRIGHIVSGVLRSGATPYVIRQQVGLSGSVAAYVVWDTAVSRTAVKVDQVVYGCYQEIRDDAFLRLCLDETQETR